MSVWLAGEPPRAGSHREEVRISESHGPESGKNPFANLPLSILNGLRAYVAVLDDRGILIGANARWRESVGKGGQVLPITALGAAYRPAARRLYRARRTSCRSHIRRKCCSSPSQRRFPDEKLRR